MDKPCSRIAVWRRVVHLFHKYKSIGFIGPYYEAGYDEYRVEPCFLDNDGEKGEPDIVATSSTSWVCLEISSWNGSKKLKLDKYKGLKPDYLCNYGLRRQSNFPDVMSARVEPVDDGPYCQLILRNKLDVEKVDFVLDVKLRDALRRAIGLDLTRIPQTKFTLIPECTGEEVRRGIIDQVMQLFEPDSQGLSAREITDNALDSLSDKIRPERKGDLVQRVKDQMDILVKDNLKDYLKTSADGKYMSIRDVTEYHASRDKISQILSKWAGLSSPKETKLTDFDSNMHPPS